MLNNPIYLIFHPLLWRWQQRYDRHLRRQLGCYSFALVSNSVIADLRRRGYLGCSFVHQFYEAGNKHEKRGHQVPGSDWPSVSCFSGMIAYWASSLRPSILLDWYHCNGKPFALILWMRQPLPSMTILPRSGSPCLTLYFSKKIRLEQKCKYLKEKLHNHSTNFACTDRLDFMIVFETKEGNHPVVFHRMARKRCISLLLIFIRSK